MLPDAFDFFCPIVTFPSSPFFWEILWLCDVDSTVLYICDVYCTLSVNGHMKTDATQYGWIHRACVDVIQRVRVDVIVRQLWGM